jgi:hypothetical protein
MKRIVRTNKWHSVLVRVWKAPSDNGMPGKEIRLAADQKALWNSTYLTPKAARKLAMVLLQAANEAETK